MHLFYLYLSFVLCSLCSSVLSRSSHSNFFPLTTCPKGKMDSSRRHSHITPRLWFVCVTVSSCISSPSSLSLLPLHWHFFNSHFCTIFSSPCLLSSLSFFPLPPSPPSFSAPQTKGCVPLPLSKAPSHCKRMSLSHRKQSAFIMSYLRGPPRQQS